MDRDTREATETSKEGNQRAFLTPRQALSIIAAMDPDGMGRTICAHVVDMAYAAVLDAPLPSSAAQWLREHVPSVEMATIPVNPSHS